VSTKMRLTRLGTKKKPYYRIVVIDSHAKRDGKCLDVVGHYNPLTTPLSVDFNEEKVSNWLATGVVLSDTVKNLLTKVHFFQKQEWIRQGMDEQTIAQKIAEFPMIREIPKKKKPAKKAE